MKGLNMVKAGRQIIAGEGAAALLTGFGPTAVGYLIQGGGKFAGYEYFKKRFMELAGGPEKAVPHRTAISTAASWTENCPTAYGTCLKSNGTNPE